MKQFTCLVACFVLWTCVGCADPTTNLPGNVPTAGQVSIEPVDPKSLLAAPRTLARTPTIHSDPDLLVAAQERFELELDEYYNSAIDSIALGLHVSLEHQQALAARREQALSDLHGLLDDTNGAPRVRCVAAEVLVELGDATGEQFLFDAISEDRSEHLRRAAALSLGNSNLKGDFHAGDRPARLLALLEMPGDDHVAWVSAICSRHQIAGTEQRLLELLSDESRERKWRLALSLARVASTPESLELALRELLGRRRGSVRAMVAGSLRTLIDHPDPQLKEMIRAALRAYLLEFESFNSERLVRELGRVADQTTLPTLERICQESGDEVIRERALEAIVRLQPETALDRYLEHVQRHGLNTRLLESLGPSVRESDFDRLLPVLINPEGGQRPIDLPTTMLLFERLGPRGRGAIRERLDQLDGPARVWTHWQLHHLDLSKALNDLKAAGVIRSEPSVLIAGMEAEPQPTSQAGGTGRARYAPHDPRSLYLALAREQILLGPIHNAVAVPCLHHHLIQDFAAHSRGVFEPRWPVQIWHRRFHADTTAAYTLEFVTGDKLIRVGVENRGQHHDEQAVLRAVNFSLEQAGHPERFLILEPAPKRQQYLCADPASLQPIVEKYALPISLEDEN